MSHGPGGGNSSYPILPTQQINLGNGRHLRINILPDGTVQVAPSFDYEHRFASQVKDGRPVMEILPKEVAEPERADDEARAHRAYMDSDGGPHRPSGGH
jgi:hypothetical protein